MSTGSSYIGGVHKNMNRSVSTYVVCVIGIEQRMASGLNARLDIAGVTGAGGTAATEGMH